MPNLLHTAFITGNGLKLGYIGPNLGPAFAWNPDVSLVNPSWPISGDFDIDFEVACDFGTFSANLSLTDALLVLPLFGMFFNKSGSIEPLMAVFIQIMQATNTASPTATEAVDVTPAASVQQGVSGVYSKKFRMQRVGTVGTVSFWNGLTWTVVNTDPYVGSSAVTIYLGDGDGVTTVFNLPDVPVTGTVVMTVAGIVKTEGVDYTVVGSAITFATPPPAPDNVYADYRLYNYPQDAMFVSGFYSLPVTPNRNPMTAAFDVTVSNIKFNGVLL